MPDQNPNRSRSYSGDMMREGSDGEARAYDFLSRLSHAHIEDVRSDSFWQQRDVDYLFTRMDDSVLTVEVKSDRHIAQSGNVLFELARLHHTSRDVCAYLGWSVFTEADRLLVWCPPAERLYVFVVSELRSAMQRYTQKTRQLMKLNIVSTDTLRTTINILIPLTEVPHRVFACVNNRWQSV